MIRRGGIAAKLLAVVVMSPAAFPGSTSRKPEKAILHGEFLFDRAPFASCHASTIVETRRGMAAAWFGGSAEGRPDIGVWFSRSDGNSWSVPVEVASGIQVDGTRCASWNPVLFQPEGGPLLLFYKVGLSPRSWWGMLITSSDNGETWSPPRRLPDGILGPVKNKPVQMPGGVLLCPSSTEDAGWRVHLERTSDFGATWTKTGPLNDGKAFAAIQPAILIHPRGRIQLLCRSRQGRVAECWSEDGGASWTAMRATSLPNPNSGLDAVTLRDGRHLLVYNPTTKGRTPLAVAISSDGKTWASAAVLEDGQGEYSYPAVIQTSDGLVHVTYTWKRERIKHAVLDPGRIKKGPLKTPRLFFSRGNP